jgi:2-methylcitrate dehydratase PrpD
VTIEAPLAEALEWLFRARLPVAVETKARELVLDTLGCVLAARRHPEVAAFDRQLEAADPGSASSAAAQFAISACWDEACEGLARAHGRPGIAVLAACGALARAKSLSLQQVIEAYVTGYEVGGRLGEAMRIAPGMHVDGTWPSLGVAAAVVRLLGGNAAQALAAVRIAACQLPNSLYLPVTAGANARNTYLAHAAQLGMLAAYAALGGIVAPVGALPEGTLASANEWLILEAYLKPYAAVRHVHYGAAAAQALLPEVGGRLKEIRGIELSVYKEALTYCSNRAPRTAIQAQFSLTYGVACMLATGELGADSYSMGNPGIQELEKKIILFEDATLAGRGATLTIRIGIDILTKKVEQVVGDPSLPMSREEILAKFSRYAGRDGTAILEAPGERRYADIIPP